MKNILEKLLNGRDLSVDESYNLMVSIMSGDYDEAQISGLLIALRAKGEAVDEIIGFAKGMREKMITVPISSSAIDMCGTGGDESGTFNISTAASFVVAGAGVHVAKHGNRSMTSKSGSADVLESLGIDINLPLQKSAANIDKIGLGFLFAPSFHPAMKYAMPVRKSIACRTVFNILGPLSNPANVKAQAMGIFSPDLTEVQCNVLKSLGSTNVMVFHSNDGLDEISNTSKTKISQFLNDGEVTTYEFDPENLGVKRASLNDIVGGTPHQNANIIINILKGKTGPKRDVVLLNSAAGILVGGKAKTFEESLDLAKESIDSGAALKVLNRLRV